MLKQRSSSVEKSQFKIVKKKWKKAVIDILDGFKDRKFNVGARGEKIKVSFSLFLGFSSNNFSSFSFVCTKNKEKKFSKSFAIFFAPATETLS